MCIRDRHADVREARLPHAKAAGLLRNSPNPIVAIVDRRVARCEVVLLVEQRNIRDVHLAIDTEHRSVGVDDRRRVAIDAHGSMLGVYRKMHIPDDPLFNEKYYFTPGDTATDDRGDRIGTVAKQASGFRVWKTRFANIGVSVSYTHLTLPTSDL